MLRFLCGYYLFSTFICFCRYENKKSPKGDALNLKSFAKILVLAPIFAGLFLSFQNCSRTAFVQDELGSLSSDCSTNPSGPGCTATPEVKCKFNGVDYSEGQTVVAYLASSVPAGQVCKSEIRQCQNGTFSGSYQYATCSVGAAASCLFNGQTVAHGATVKAYQASSVPYGSSCVSQDRVCNNGTLSGSYSYGSCSVGTAASCLFNGQTVAHGATVKAYQAATVPYGSTCASQDRSCNNGVLSGSYAYNTCRVSDPPVNKISCSVSSMPATKPSGLPYSSTYGYCAPASGNGPSYKFTITCDADLPSDPKGIRIQYNMNYTTPITNATAFMNNSTFYYRGRSFYKPEVNPNPGSYSIVYGLNSSGANSIYKTGPRTVVAQADFFFIDGYPADTSTQNCGTLKSMDLNIFIWIDKDGTLQHFNDNPAQITLQ